MFYIKGFIHDVKNYSWRTAFYNLRFFFITFLISKMLSEHYRLSIKE